MATDRTTLLALAALLLLVAVAFGARTAWEHVPSVLARETSTAPTSPPRRRRGVPGGAMLSLPVR